MEAERREGYDIARCTVERLMRDMGLAGVIRGEAFADHDQRQGSALSAPSCPAPNMLWVSDFTHVATSAGFVYVAFVIDTYARRIVGR